MSVSVTKCATLPAPPGTVAASVCGLRESDWKAEFTSDTPVDVRVLPGCLILTAQEPQPVTEPEVLTRLRQVCKKLSARKQRQIAEFIQVIAQPQKRPPQPGRVEWDTMYRSK